MKSFINKMIAQRYRCIEKIGSGGMGVVYLAEDTMLQRQVVLKMLQPTLQSEKATSRFLREAKILSRLNHPHIVTIHDFGVWEDIMFIVLEHLEGKNLYEIIQERDPLPTKWIMETLAQIMEALKAAHRAGILHRDLKPSNIFCLPQPDQADFIKILDFGTAIPMNRKIYKRITTGSEVIGTPHYMSPEQIMGKEDLSQQSDIYSLGIILYEMLSGEPPFLGENTMTILLAHLYQTPRPLYDKEDQDDPQRLRLWQIVDTCLNKNPEDRFDSIQELERALSRVPQDTERLAENLTQERQDRYKQFYQGPVAPDRAGAATRIKAGPKSLQLLAVEPDGLPLERSLKPMLEIAYYALETPTSLDRDRLEKSELPDVIILNKGKEENLQLIQDICKNPAWQKIPYLVCGPEEDLDYISKTIEAGASDYISQPFDPKEILKKINRFHKKSPDKT